LGKSSNIKERNVYVDVEILEPKLWWPNGIGIPFIYDFVVEIQHQSNEVIHSQKIPYGIRSVKLDQKDKKFTIVVNGYPVYGKGANYVPMDMFYPRLTNKNFKSPSSI
jgi:beta-mannosidase